MESPPTSPKERTASKKIRALIADLPKGVSCYHDGGYIRVRLGKAFTGGTEVKRSFSKLSEARDFIFGDEARQKKMRIPGVIDLKRDLGTTAFDIPRGVYAEAIVAWEELGKVKSPGGILEAVKFYIKHTSLTQGTWTIKEASAALEKKLTQLNRDERYRKGLSWSYGRLAEDFPDTCIHEISKSEILDWLEEEDFGLVTRNNYIRDLKVLFNFAETEKRLGMNPMKEIKREEVPDGEVCILNVRDTARVILAAMRLPGMLVPTAIKFFAGLRTSEVRRLQWEEIKRNSIVVLAKKAKTRSRRAVTISDNLRSWLAKDRQKSGPVFPSGRQWRTSFELLRVISGINPWPRNCQRHSFGSYHLAKYKNENLTASEMGNSPEIIVRHYRAVVEDASETTRFWGLNPKNVRKFAEVDDQFEAALAILE